MASHEFNTTVISLADIEAAIERARAERAVAMREMLVGLAVRVKRVLPHLPRPQQTPPLRPIKSCA